MPSDRTQFLYESVRDFQNTIRALDAKTNYIMVILIIPLAKLGVIYAKCGDLLRFPNHWSKWVLIPLIFVFALSWCLALVAVFKALAAIDNPADHVAGDHPRGTFYSAGLFRIGFRNIFFNRALLSESQFQQHLADAPATDDAIASELAFEQMKLCYIREVKMIRSRATYILSMIWIITGGALWLSWLKFV